jgi:CheY-like chemotaxis protein
MNNPGEMRSETIVLIAEDDDGHFTLIKNTLRREGVSNPIIRFTDGQETLDFLFENCSKGNFDHSKDYILILDILIPKIKGSEVLETMKRNSRLIDIPVIVLTTTDDPDQRTCCDNAGCSIYIVKPISHEDFQEAVRKISRLIAVT